MKMQCSIDLENNKILLDGSWDAKRVILDFVTIGDPNKKINLKNLKFGYQLQKNGKEITEESWPIAGVTFAEASPGIITSADISLSIDQDYKLLVWYTNGLNRHTDVKIFNSGKPFKMYDSMVWDEQIEEWQFPVPYPKNTEKPLVWDEESISWKPWEDLVSLSHEEVENVEQEK
jgi:hypothetical protein